MERRGKVLAVGTLIAFTVGALLLRRKAHAATLGPGALSDAQLSRLLGARHLPDRSAIDAGRLDVIRGILAGLADSGLSTDQQLALVAVAWREGDLKLSVRSAVGLADDKQGGSYTTFQLRRNAELARALAATGQTFADVVPTGPVSGVEAQTYAARQARCALWLLRQDRPSGADAEAWALDLAVKWGAGASRSWSWASSQPNVVALLGGAGRIPSASDLPAVYAKLRAAGLDITAGALGKLAAFRTLRGALA